MQTNTQMQVDTNQFLSVMDDKIRVYLKDPRTAFEQAGDKTVGFIKDLFTFRTEDLHAKEILSEEEYAACKQTNAHSLSVILYALPAVLMHELSMHKMSNKNQLVLFKPFDSVYIGDVEDTLNINGKYGLDIVFNQATYKLGATDKELFHLENVPYKLYNHVVETLITKDNIKELFAWSDVNTIVLNYRVADVLGVDFIRLIRKGSDSIFNPLGSDIGTATQVLVQNPSMPLLGNYVIPATIQDHITLNVSKDETKAIFLETKNYEHKGAEIRDFEERAKADPFIWHSLNILRDVKNLFPLVISIPKARDYSASMKSKYVAYVNEDHIGFNSIPPEVEKKSFFKRSN